MAYATVVLEDKDGDGRSEFVLHGGIIASVGAGPQRSRTEIYAWDGAAYTLKQTILDPTQSMYLHVREADAAFNAGHYEEAFSIYKGAMTGLETWAGKANAANESDELHAYVLFRMGLSSFALNGPNPDGLGYIQRAVSSYSGSLNGGMAAAFLSGYLDNGNLSQGCDALDVFVASNLKPLHWFWDYGYSNPGFNANTVCPF